MIDNVELVTKQAQLLQKIAHRIVVIGGVARCPGETRKDCDLIYDMDSDKATEEIRKAVEESGLDFVSCLPGNWSFPGLEILPIHSGPSYRTCRRAATQQIVNPWGVLLWVAKPEHAPGKE